MWVWCGKWAGGFRSPRRVKTIQRDIEKLIPVAMTMPTTAAASRCRSKNPTRNGR